MQEQLMYCNREDVEGISKVIQTLTEGEEDTYINPYIIKATGDVNSRLCSRYQVPLCEPIPQVIINITSDLAASFILEEHTTERFKDQTTYGDVLYKRAIRSLDRILEFCELDNIVNLSKGRDSSSNRPSMLSTNYMSKSLIDSALDKF